MSKKGFTLTEVLVVVVITMSIVAFSVPLYKRTQEKARYNSALGVLMQLGGAVKMLRTDMEMEGLSYSFPTDAEEDVLQIGTNTTYVLPEDYPSVRDASTIGAIDKSQVKYALRIRGYLPEVPLAGGDDGFAQHNGYYYYVCGKQKANTCCVADTAVVCTKYLNTPVPENYECAVYHNDGSVERVQDISKCGFSS